MNAREVAKFLNLHPNTIYNMIRKGEIEAEKDGRSYEIPEHEVERLLKESDTVDRKTDKRMAIKELMLDIDMDIERQLTDIHELNKKLNDGKETPDKPNLINKMVANAQEIAKLESLKGQLKKQLEDDSDV